MKTKHFFILFLIHLLNINSYSQKSFISYDKVKVEDITSIEKSFYSKTYQSKLETVEGTEDTIIRYGKPKYYNRQENKSYGKIQVTYYYLEKDSLVRKISYSWITPKNTKLEDYSKKFDKVVEQISSDLGKPKPNQGKLTKIYEENLGERHERRVTWNYKDAEITLLMIWSRNHGANLNIGVNWKNK